MAKNRLTMHPNPQTPPMSSSHTHTIGLTMGPLVADDDEDNDICPVCDGECTCDNRPVSLITHSTNHFNSPSTSAHPSPISVSSKPDLPSLKIKLTVPPSMLGKRRAHPSSSNKLKHIGETTYVVEAGGDVPPSPFSPIASGSHVHSVKRKGRPPKPTPAACGVAVRPARAGGTLPSITASPTSHLIRRNPTLLGKQKYKPTAPRLPAKLKGKGTTVKKAASKRRRLVSSSESSDLSDEDDEFGFDDDTQSGQFPTFVSASIMSSTSSNESDAASLSLSGFDSDSSIEAEEENYIVQEEGRAHDKARIRRELLGDEGQKKRDPHNDWVIRPRKQSVGPEEAEMEVDSDATEDEDEDEEEDDEDDEEEETDGRGTGAGYVGVATGWSDDEESSFDADLFFANLSDSGDSDASSMSDDDGAGDDGDQSDLDAASYGSASITSLPPRIREDLPFEVMEGWDGQIGVLEMDFEVNAAQFVAETSVPPSQESDVEMSTSEPDEGGYEEDGDGGEGDTTDEELVGEDELPNERAMRLFALPFSISAINPMSTMSPTVSPGPRSRRPFGSQGHPNSPKPADILAGKVFWDSDDHEEFEDSHSKSTSRGGVPRTGKFECVHEIRKAIIDDSHKDIPSPHPRFHGRGKVVSRMGRRDSVNSVFCTHNSSSRTSSISASVRSPFQFDDIVPTSPDMPPAEPIGLDDVLEASFLDPDPFDQQGSTILTASDGESHTPSENPNRWDHIPVSAFRQTQESGSLTDTTAPGWVSDSPVRNTDYESMMKSSLSAYYGPIKPPSHPNATRIWVLLSLPSSCPFATRKNYGSSHHPHQNHHHHFHQHHPNSKTRSSSSSQRSNFFGSSVPPLNI
ncbi:hypothetical protein BD779DRAFT_1534952 [Infundibulicybe gibba]|nr:hypothetical protein BD779DRAFT_1534952 [Infundibulicybe gibba]